MSTIDLIKRAEAIALTALDTPTGQPPAPAPDNSGHGTATDGDAYRGRYPTATDPRIKALRPPGRALSGPTATPRPRPRWTVRRAWRFGCPAAGGPPAASP